MLSTSRRDQNLAVEGAGGERCEALRDDGLERDGPVENDVVQVPSREHGHSLGQVDVAHVG